jgi:hypothetical protein
MLTEAAPIALAPLLFEINAGALLLMAGAFAAHEATAAWDVSMTAPRRVIETTEQHIHSVLEMMPFGVASLYVASHWDKLRAILRHPHAADFRLRLKQPRASAAQVVALCSAITLLDLLPHAEELWRCIAAKQKGLTGRDSPECAAALYGKNRAAAGALSRVAAPLPEPPSPPAAPVASTPQSHPEAAALS